MSNYLCQPQGFKNGSETHIIILCKRGIIQDWDVILNVFARMGQGVHVDCKNRVCKLKFRFDTSMLFYHDIVPMTSLSWDGFLDHI